MLASPEPSAGPPGSLHDEVDAAETFLLTSTILNSTTSPTSQTTSDKMSDSFRSVKERADRMAAAGSASRPDAGGRSNDVPATTRSSAMRPWIRGVRPGSVPASSASRTLPAVSPGTGSNIPQDMGSAPQTTTGSTRVSIATPMGSYVPKYMDTAPQTSTDSAYFSRPITDVSGGYLYPTKHQLEIAYSYGYERPDGSYTRLVPADLLPPIIGISQHQGPEGLIIVPPPRASSPRSREGLTSSPIIISQNVIQTLPRARPCQASAVGDDRPEQSRSNDALQYQIDTIVARGPQALTYATPPPTSNTGLGPVVSMSSRIPDDTPAKKEKIYCDKWVHEGVCAFTQQGCKYKHEMPLDKATQRELGLNNGLPAWYKRQQAVQLLPNPVGASAPAGHSQVSTRSSWRRAKPVPGPATGPSTRVGLAFGIAGGSFGPIAPPRRQSQQLRLQPNRFSVLEEEDQ